VAKAIAEQKEKIPIPRGENNCPRRHYTNTSCAEIGKNIFLRPRNKTEKVRLLKINRKVIWKSPQGSSFQTRKRLIKLELKICTMAGVDYFFPRITIIIIMEQRDCARSNCNQHITMHFVVGMTFTSHSPITYIQAPSVAYACFVLHARDHRFSGPITRSDDQFARITLFRCQF